MPDLQALLAEIDRLDQEATQGPWATDSNEHEVGVIYGAEYEMNGYIKRPILTNFVEDEVANAEFIALARTALPQLAKALRAVLEKSEIAHDVLRDRVVKPTEHDVGRSDMADDIQKAITDAMEADGAS